MLQLIESYEEIDDGRLRRNLHGKEEIWEELIEYFRVCYTEAIVQNISILDLSLIMPESSVNIKYIPESVFQWMFISE